MKFQALMLLAVAFMGIAPTTFADDADDADVAKKVQSLKTKPKYGAFVRVDEKLKKAFIYAINSKTVAEKLAAILKLKTREEQNNAVKDRDDNAKMMAEVVEQGPVMSFNIGKDNNNDAGTVANLGCLFPCLRRPYYNGGGYCGGGYYPGYYPGNIATPYYGGFGAAGVSAELSVSGYAAGGAGYGVGYPGVGYPGVGYPGVGYPGVGYPGVGYPGVGYPGIGYPGIGYPGYGAGGYGAAGVSGSVTVSGYAGGAAGGGYGVGYPGIGYPGYGVGGYGASAAGFSESVSVSAGAAGGFAGGPGYGPVGPWGFGQGVAMPYYGGYGLGYPGGVAH